MNRRLLTCLGLLGLFLASSAARAAPAQFVVDPTQSSLTIAPTVSVLGTQLTVTPQAPGSLTTSYSGTIDVDLTATSIQFLATTSVIAENSGNWQPGTDYSNYPADLDAPDGYVNTAEPANYGLITDLTPLGAVLGKQGLSPSATRGIMISLNSVARTLSGGAFDEAGIDTTFTSGIVYYSSGGSPPVTDLANTVNPGAFVDVPALTGTLTEAGGIETLTIPVKFNVTYNVNFLTLSTDYTGTIVATRIVPEPSSLSLLATASGCLFFWTRRRFGRCAAR